jgi:hypothetical protein
LIRVYCLCSSSVIPSLLISSYLIYIITILVVINIHFITTFFIYVSCPTIPNPLFSVGNTDTINLTTMDSLLNLTPRDAPKILTPGPPPAAFATPSLTANLICRVVFALLGNLLCLVPLGLLYRNGELAAAILILVVELQNFENTVNALIWHNDDVESWWPGYGFCDVDSHIRNLGIGLFNTCLLAIMRNLALQIGNLRASPLTKKEKMRRNIVQALIIFPLPLLQVAWTYPLAQQRYYIGTLTGCSWVNSHSWPYMVFDIFLPVLMSILTAGYASKSKCRNHDQHPTQFSHQRHNLNATFIS